MDDDLIATAKVPPSGKILAREDKAGHAAFWNAVWRGSVAPSIDTCYEARLLCAWRLIRRMGEMRGALSETQPLSEMAKTFDHQNLNFIRTDDASEVLPEAIEECLDAGLSLGPPLLDAPHEAVKRFARVVHEVGKQLDLARNPKTAAGMPWFVDPDTVQTAWPTMTHLIEFEDAMIAHTRRELLEKTNMAVVEGLRERLGVPDHVAFAVVGMCLKSLVNMSHLNDRAGVKARVLARMERAAEAANLAFDHRGAAIIEREYWRIFRDEATLSDDALEDMTNEIKKGAALARGASNPRLEDDDEDDD
jgi:hypothetical protein